jgi:hypothetical protein
MGLTKEDLVGTYRLLYGGIERSDGAVEYPYGEDAIGYLIYLENDRVSWHIMAGKPPNLFRSGSSGWHSRGERQSFQDLQRVLWEVQARGGRHPLRHRGGTGAEYDGCWPQLRLHRRRRTSHNLKADADRWRRRPDQICLEAGVIRLRILFIGVGSGLAWVCARHPTVASSP